MKQMKWKKWMAACMAAALICPAISVQAVSFNPIDFSDLSGYEMPANYGKLDETQTDNLSGYDAVKKVAEEKASYLISAIGSTSVQYALIDNGEIKISGSSGVYSKMLNQELTKDNMYGTGSISKVYTTAAVMKLVEEGKVDLDGKVTQYISGFKMADSRYKDITVRMLLNHSSGLMGTSMGSMMLFGDNDTRNHDNFLTTLKGQKLKADPGAFSVYCNDGFTLAEILIEKVTGMSFTKYINDTLITPLGLTNTKTPQDSFESSKLSKVYIPKMTLGKDLPADIMNMIGAGGIFSTAEELCQFATIFMNQNTNTQNILSQASVDAMEQLECERGIWPKDGDSTLDYGLGWDSVKLFPFNQYKIQALTKGGDTQFYHSSLIVLPEENMAVAVMASGALSSYCQLAGIEILQRALKEKGVITENLPEQIYGTATPKAVPASQKKYAGSYKMGVNLLKASFDNKDNLVISTPDVRNSSVQKYFYGGDGRFYDKSMKTYIRFVKESNGVTYMQNAGYASVPGFGQTAFNTYAAEKYVANKPSAAAKKAWKARTNKIYFLTSEKYTSEMYPLAGVVSGFQMDHGTSDGFVNGAAILTKDHALGKSTLPGTGGRDLYEYKITTKNKIEYLQMNDYEMISQEGLKTFPTKKNMTCTISSSGDAVWYKLPKTSQKISVKLPKEGAFAVYKSNGTVVNASYVSGKTKVTLPKNGYLVFSGEPKAKFSVTYQK